LPEEWKETIILPLSKKGDKTDCNNYRGISFLSTAYKILSNILLSRLIIYVEEIVGDNPCGYRNNSSTTAFVKYLRKTREKMKQCIRYL